MVAADTNWVKEDTNLSRDGQRAPDARPPGAPTGTFGDNADTDVDGDTLTVTTTGTFTGQYGTLFLNADGSYTYTLFTQAQNAAAYAIVQGLSPTETLQETFNYSVTDGSSTVPSTLTITVFGTDDGLSWVVNHGVIDEDDLPAGSDTAKESLTWQSSFTFLAPDGIKTLLIRDANNNVIDIVSGSVVSTFPLSITTPLGNTLTVTAFNPATGVVTYEYTLNGAETHSPGAGENNLIEQFVVTIVDEDPVLPESISVGLNVEIIDDVPTAANDVDSVIVTPVQVLRFDDIPLADDGEQPIPANYGGFVWTQTGVYNPPDGSNYVPSSGANLAFIAEAGGFNVPGYPGNPGDPATASSGPFAFLGASFVSLNTQNLQITVIGTLVGGGTVTATITALLAVPTFIDFSALPGFAGASLVGISFDADDYFGFDDFTTQGVTPPATGNVITGADGGLGSDANGTDGVADTVGADGLGNITWTNQAGNTVAGAHGVLTVDANGNYSYAVNTNDPFVRGLDGNDQFTETFTYSFTDADGDPATATLTITVTGADDPVSITGLTPAANGGDVVVDEDDLAAGSDTTKESLTGTGTFQISAPDGITSLTVGGQAVITNGVFTPISFVTLLGNTLMVTGYNAATGILAYTYTLGGAETHAPGGGENSLAENFIVTLTDTDGSTASATLSAVIVDDVPDVDFAGATTVNENGAPVNGTFLFDAGADGVLLGNLYVTVGADLFRATPPSWPTARPSSPLRAR